MWIIAGSLVSIAITAAKFMSVFKVRSVHSLSRASASDAVFPKSSSGAFEPCYQAQDRLFALETARVAAVSYITLKTGVVILTNVFDLRF